MLSVQALSYPMTTSIPEVSWPRWSCYSRCECKLRKLLDKLTITYPEENLDDINSLKDRLKLVFTYNRVMKSVSSLKGTDAVMFQDLLHAMTFLDSDSSDWVVHCCRWMRKLGRHSGELPSSLFLEGIQRVGELPISGGGFADIYLGLLGETKVALKVLRIFNTEQETRRVLHAFCQEALVWMQLSHPYVLPFMGVSQELFRPRLCLISPWMEKGNIRQYLENHASANRLQLLCQVAQGVEYLHSCKIIHGDIRGANILIDEGDNACIADMGLVTISESHVLVTTTGSNTGGAVRWMAPELIKGLPKNYSTDVYAFGMTVYEVLTGNIPFHNLKQDFAVMAATLSGERPYRPTDTTGGFMLPDDLWYLMENWWSEDADARQNMATILFELKAYNVTPDKVEVLLEDSTPEMGASAATWRSPSGSWNIVHRSSEYSGRLRLTSASSTTRSVQVINNNVLFGIQTTIGDGAMDIEASDGDVTPPQSGSSSLVQASCYDLSFPLTDEEVGVIENKTSIIVEELFHSRNREEAVECFRSLPLRYHHSILQKVLRRVMTAQDSDACFVASFLQQVLIRNFCTSWIVWSAFSSNVCFMKSIAVDVPCSYKLTRTVLSGSGLPSEYIERLIEEMRDALYSNYENDYMEEMAEGDVPMWEVVAQKQLSKFDSIFTEVQMFGEEWTNGPVWEAIAQSQISQLRDSIFSFVSHGSTQRVKFSSVEFVTEWYALAL